MLVSHGRDNDAGLLSWVVGEFVYPRSASNSESFKWFAPESSDIQPLPENIRKLTMDTFKLTENQAFHTLVVRKLGVLVTDDMRPLTVSDKDSPSNLVNAPVIFV